MLPRTTFALASLLLSSLPLHTQLVDVYSRPVQTERPRQFDALHYRIVISLDDRTNSFEGATTIFLIPLQKNFTSCTLHAGMFVVSGVENETGKLSFHQEPDRLVIDFPVAYTPRDTVRFTVHYRAEHLTDSTGQTHGMNFMPANERHPAQIFTRSFPRGARNWFPCYDEPNDKATQEVIATVRNDYPLLSNGRLVSVTENKAAGTKTFHWSQSKPHSTYLSVIMAAPYVVIKDSLGALPVNYWVYPGDVRHVASTFPRTPEIITLFNKEYGFDYPWEKYDQATIAGVGGGAECTSASELGEGMMHDEKAEKDFSSYGWLICHEAAHQWWGDLITCRDWTHTWLNESFGSYSEVMYALYDKGEDEASLNVLGKKNDYLREAHTRYMRPIVFDRWNEPGDNFDRHTYQKGAALIHHMRWLLGEKPFHDLLAAFLKKHAFQPADTHDFMTAVKEATGQNLDWFFEDWFLKPGHPVFDVRYTWNKGTNNLSITIEQVQDTLHGVPVFRTPVLIRIVDHNGSRTYRRDLKNRKETFVFKSEKPLMVRFDEGNHLLKEWTFEKTTEELLYQMKRDDVIGRLWAIEQLTRRDDPSVGEALVAAAGTDPHWAARRDAAYRLGGFQGTIEMDLDRGVIPQSRLDSVRLLKGLDQSAVLAALKKLLTDTNSQVRAAAAYGLGNMQIRKEVALLQSRYAVEDSYLVQAAILRALGKLGDPSVRGLLQKAKETESPRNILRSAAQWALGRLEDKER